MNDQPMHFRRAWLAAPVALACPMILLILGIAATAHGQNSGNEDDPFSGIEEMIVFGGSGVGTLTDASVSVTAFDASELEALGVSDISDVAAFTPNLEIRTASSTTATFFIRGVGLNDFTANASSAVAVYTDDAPRNLPAIQLGLLYDLDQIEVLKGPQGSGPGRNASAGAIRIFTRKPKNEYSAYGRVDYGNYNLVDVEGALEVPVIDDVFGIRAAFRKKTRDGIVTNRCGGKTQAEIDAVASICRESTGVIRPNLETDLNDNDVWSTRLSARYVPPIDDMEWVFTGHVDRVDQLGTVGQHIGASSGTYGGSDKASYQDSDVSAERTKIQDSLNIPTPRDCRDAGPAGSPERAACNAQRAELQAQVPILLANSLADRPLDKQPFEGDYNTPGFERQTSWGLLLAGDWQIDAFTLKSITGYERYDRDRLLDADFSPNVFFEFAIDDDAWQFTQDLRLSGELESTPLSWETGVFVLVEELDYSQETLSESRSIRPVLQEYRQDTTSVGYFADAQWELLDDFTLEGGFRYNWERKRIDSDIFVDTALRDQCVPNSEGVAPPCTRTDTVDHPTGTVGLKYRIDELRTVYMKYSHGWKGLQYNVRTGTRRGEVTDVADPEVIDAFEIGFDGSWLEDRVKLGGSLFWYDYSNYQVFTFTNDVGDAPTRIVINANDAQLYGAELQLTLEPIDRLILDFRGSWLESKFLDFTDTGVRPDPGGAGTDFFNQTFDFNGNQLPNAPRFKLSGSIDYAFDLGGAGTLTPRYDFVWTDDVNFDPSGGTGAPSTRGETFMPDTAIGQADFILHNFRITYKDPTETLEIAGWVRNFTNEVYKSLAYDASGGPGFVGNLVGDPRTYGLSAKVSF